MREDDHRIDEIYVKYGTLIKKNAYFYVRDDHIAEDICQETFVRLLVNIDKIEAKKVKSWLLQVSEHLAIDYMRKGGKYSTSVGLEEYTNTLVDDTYSDLSSLMVQWEKYNQKKRVLDRLEKEKPNWFEAVKMRYLEGLDNHSIGKRLGINAILVSQWLRRAGKWLRDAYEKEEQDDDPNDESGSPPR